MFDLFFKKINEEIKLSSDQKEIITKYLIPRKLRKKQYLLQEGDISETIAFVEKGALKEYRLDAKGVEHIIQFAFEGCTIPNQYYFLTSKRATYNIDAIEDCELVLIKKSSQDKILEQIPEYEKYLRMQLSSAYLGLQQHLDSMITFPLEERYIHFSESSPELLNRVPQHMIASYLGLTPETLSRIRKKMCTLWLNSIK
jgi:CRP-like cAMP-binding protein